MKTEIESNTAESKARHAQTLRAVKSDGRYSVQLVWCGYAVRKWCAYFCGGWIGCTSTEDGTWNMAVDHENGRWAA